jgi:hypothetical protein
LIPVRVVETSLRAVFVICAPYPYMNDLL